MKKHLIVGVEPHSIAHKLHIKPGDYLLTVNHETVRDVFDYRFYEADEFLTIEIEKADGEICEFDIEKDFDMELGMDFGEGLMDDYKSCTNRCIFCFIDQLPPGMRKTLYFKDDDSRLSFLQGNYVTLTNMKQADIDRIIRYHMGPINISVHTTDPELRCSMLHNRFAGEVLSYIDQLYEAGISMNGQIVLCKGINDGAQLEKTIEDLSRYLPLMDSLSVVPAGLTKYRDGLYPLEKFTREEALEVIKTVEKYQEKLYNKQLNHFVHASDEFYLLAGLDVPAADTYDGYPQLENGVGMLRLLEEEFHEALADAKADDASKGRCISIATGRLAYPYLSAFAKEFMQVFPQTKIHVYEVANTFFGEDITVSGLLCGCDIIHTLQGQELGEALLLPVNMFRAGEEYFLDDVTRTQAEEALGVPITIVGQTGDDFYQALCGTEQTDYRRQCYEQADCSDCRQA